MLLVMEKSNQILEFPTQEKDLNDLYGLELVEHCRLYGANLLSKVALGVWELTEKNKESLHGINESCKEWGLPPLEGDF